MHGDQRDHDGSLHTDHLRRVVGLVSVADEPVAWLHDTLEDTAATVDDLRQMLSTIEVGAVMVLTRQPDENYGAYIDRIVQTEGIIGRIARAVKTADLMDNLARSIKAEHSLRERYEPALVKVLAA